MSLEQLLAWIPAGIARRIAGASGQLRAAARPHRHHHGRQRTLGGAAPPAARRRPPRRHRLGPRRRRDLGAARHRRPDAVRVLGRELEAAARGSQHADDAAEALHQARAEHAAAEQHPLPGDRPSGGARARRPGRARVRHPADRREHRHAVQHRAELRRPRGNRRRRAAGDRRRGCRPTTSTSAVRRASLHGRTARPRSAHSHERRDARQQLPALADRLLRDLGHRNALAGFPPPRSARGGRRLPEARSPLRRHQAVAGGARRQVQRHAVSRAAPVAAIAAARSRSCLVGAGAGCSSLVAEALLARWRSREYAAARAGERRCACRLAAVVRGGGADAAPRSRAWPFAAARDASRSTSS